MIRSVYLAARYARREELLVYRRSLTSSGIHCTSTWLDGEGTDLARNARIDLEDVRRSDAIVCFSEEPLEFSPLPFAARGGRHVEFGVALERGLDVLVVGPSENIFHHLHDPKLQIMSSWAEALRWLSANAERGIQ